jgi:hypothetical protein
MIDPDGPKAEAKRRFIRSWFSWALGVTLGLLAIYYLLFHLLFGAPLQMLRMPGIIQCGATILIGPLIITAVSRFKASEGTEFGLFYIAATLILLCTALCWIYLGLHSGVLPQADQPVLYTIAVLGGIFGPLASYLLRKSLKSGARR